MSQLWDSRGPVDFVGSVDGERRRVKVTLTSVLLGSGMAFFEGSEASRVDEL